MDESARVAAQVATSNRQRNRASESNKSKVVHAKNRTVDAPSARAKMIIDNDTRTNGQADELREHSSELTLCEHPSRMTHGHWLRRYSGLHAPDTSAPDQARRSPPASPAAAAAKATGQEEGQQNWRPASKRPRLLPRWTTAMWAGHRSAQMGGSTGDVTTRGGLLAAPGERAGASSAPPSASATADRRGESQSGNVPGSRKSRAAHSHDSRAASTARLANGTGQHQHHFGCQLCGWRSHAASSSCSSCSSASVSPAGVDHPPPGARSPGKHGPEAGATPSGRSPSSHLASWLMRSVPSPRAAAVSARRNKPAPGSSCATDRKRQQLPVLDVGGTQQGAEKEEEEEADGAELPSSRRASPYRQLARFLGAAVAGKLGEPREHGQQQVAAAAASANVKANARNLVASLFASPRKRRDSGGDSGQIKRRVESRDEKLAAKRDEELDEKEGGEPIHLTKSDSRDKMSRANANEISKRIESLRGRRESKSPDEMSTEASRQVNDNFKLVGPCASDIATSCERGQPERDKREEARGGPNGSLGGQLLQASDGAPMNANELREADAAQFEPTWQSGRPRAADDHGQLQLNETKSGPSCLMDPNSRLRPASGLVAAAAASDRAHLADSDAVAHESASPVTSRLISLAAATQRRQFESSLATGGAPTAAAHFAPLIQPTLASSSSSSFASSSLYLDSAAISTGDQGQPRLADKTTAAVDRQPRDLSSLVTSSVDKSAPPRAHPDQPPAAIARARPHSQPSSDRRQVAASGQEDESASTTSGTTFGLRTNFKKLVKRQQSVDSYRMARDLKQKLKRQQQQQVGGGATDRNKQGHHSHETIKSSDLASRAASSGRKFSMRGAQLAGDQLGALRTTHASGGPPPPPPPPAAALVEICVDPYARPGTFMLPGEQMTTATGNDQVPASEEDERERQRGAKQARASPQPPKTLSLMPAAAAAAGNNGAAAGGGHSPVSQSCVSPGGSLLMGSGFSGCITPTYPTHHLPSPKYVSPAAFMAMQKKHSNASTISSSLGVDLGLVGGGQMNGNNNNGEGVQPQTLTLAETAAASCKSDTESSFSLAPSGRASKTNDEQQQQPGLGGVRRDANDSSGTGPAAGGARQMSDAARASQAEAEAAAAAAAQRRANLAEHIYDNKCGLGEDMKFLASLPELCDITFLVGETREPVCAVKSVLAARSRVFHKIFFGSRIKAAAAAQRRAAEAAQATAADEQSQQQVADDQDRRRDSSPRSAGRNSILATGPSVSPVPKSSLPNSRSSSPNNQQQQQQPQWSVTADTSGLSSSSPRTAGTVTRADSTVVGVAGGRAGRVSVTSNGRESISQASQGSAQPLIIGPGQVATPAPVSKGGLKSKSKGRLRDSAASRGSGGDDSLGGAGGGGHSRLSRMFLNKRVSDPSIKQQHQHQNNNIQLGSGELGGQAGGPLDRGGSIDHAQNFQLTSGANQSYLDKMSSSQRSTTMIIEEFEPDVFRQLIEYIHTGCVLLQARTLLGLLNAADYYGLEQLRKACLRFVSCCITVDTVCSLLSTAERYIQYKCTKSIVQKVLEFVDTHANEIFKLNAFGLLPEHVVRLILARDGLQADEQVKYNGVYTWCEHYCRSYELTNMSDVMHNFLNLIQFHKIPTTVLLAEIYPCHIVPDDIFLSALAYQADPDVFEPQPSRQRRMTLPNSIMLKGEPPGHDRDQQRHSQDCSGGAESIGRRQSSNSAAGGGGAASTLSQQRLLLGSRKSTGGATAAWTPVQPGPVAPKQAASRKGSIAQVSLSGVKRLSHKLSIKRRHHSNMPSGSSLAGAGPTSSGDRRRRGSGGGFSLGRSELSKQASLAARSSVVSNSANQQPPCGSRDPIELGRQILEAYLLAKRQQEQEEEERRQREEDELRAAEEAKRRAAGLDDSSGGRNSESAQRASRKPLVKTPSSTRKSFRDFKHISRRIFMRHSSSKAIPVESQSQSPTNSGGKLGSSSHYRLNSREMSSDSGTSLQQQQSRFSSMDKSEGQGEGQAKARRLMKIKRSETVFEAATSLTSKLAHQRRNNAN